MVAWALPEVVCCGRVSGPDFQVRGGVRPIRAPPCSATFRAAYSIVTRHAWRCTPSACLPWHRVNGPCLQILGKLPDERDTQCPPAEVPAGRAVRAAPQHHSAWWFASPDSSASTSVPGLPLQGSARWAPGSDHASMLRFGVPEKPLCPRVKVARSHETRIGRFSTRGSFQLQER